MSREDRGRDGELRYPYLDTQRVGGEPLRAGICEIAAEHEAPARLHGLGGVVRSILDDLIGDRECDHERSCHHVILYTVSGLEVITRDLGRVGCRVPVMV